MIRILLLASFMLLKGCSDVDWDEEYKVPQVNGINMHWVSKHNEFVLVCDEGGLIVGDIEPIADVWWAETEGWPKLYHRYDDELSAASAVVKWSIDHNSCDPN